jgi:serine/threonine protein kinase
MADTKPPYSEMHPMRAIFHIPQKPPPKLANPSQWSPEFNDFIAACLVKEASSRPSAADLLQVCSCCVWWFLFWPLCRCSSPNRFLSPCCTNVLNFLSLSLLLLTLITMPSWQPYYPVLLAVCYSMCSFNAPKALPLWCR